MARRLVSIIASKSAVTTAAVIKLPFTATNHHLLRHPNSAATTTRRLMNEAWPPQGPEIEPKPWYPNEAMESGPKSFFEVWETKEGFYGWMLMPGVPKDNVNIKVVGNRVSFEGFEDPVVPGLDMVRTCRTYRGSLLVDPAKFDATRVQAEISNGILWVHVPNSSTN